MCAIRKRILKFEKDPNDPHRTTLSIHDIDVRKDQYVRLKKTLPKNCMCRVSQFIPGITTNIYPYQTEEVLGETGKVVRKDAILISNIPVMKYVIEIKKKSHLDNRNITLHVECTNKLIDKRYKPTETAPVISYTKAEWSYLHGYVLDKIS